MNYPKDLSDMQFEDWKVLGYAFTNDKGISYFNCKCSCGNERVVARNNLISGDSKSCGHESNKDQLISLEGQRFGELTVIEYIKEKKKWLCQCSCGNTTLKRSWDLRNGRGKTCGIKENHNSKKLIDLTNKEFGELKVIKYVKDRNWLCQCSCGKQLIIDGESLRNGRKISCGHSLNQNKRKDLTNKIFGDLTVSKYLTYKKYECICKCGNKRVVSANELTSGKVTQCVECTQARVQKQYNESRIDLLGKTFGDLTVIGYKQNLHKWICKCSCGNIIDVYGQHLRVGDTKSCGCKYGLSGVYRSYLEMEVHKFISDNCSYKIVNNTRGILKDNKEIDIYIPELKIAFEINGDYWHNDEHIDINYHRNKVIECKTKGIRLIHIYEYEWLYNNDKIKEFIKNTICKKEVIAARKTNVQIVDKDDTKEFLNKYHLQGYVPAEINIGTYYNNELIGIITFGKPRFNNNFQYEIIRLAYKNGVSVIGGTEKMFKYLVNNFNIDSLISYCNIDKFSGMVYEKLGMTLDKYSKHGYVWVNHKNNSVLSRYKTQKQELIKKGFGDETQTEDEIMKNNGYMKIYNSGNAVYVLKANDN